MLEFWKKLRGLFSKSYYPQDRFLREKLTMEQKVRKALSDAKNKTNEFFLGEKKSEECPYVFIEIEETYVRKLTGIRDTGGNKKEPNMFEMMHDKESQFLRGIVPAKPPYPATSPLPDSSGDRPAMPEDPDSDYDDEDYGWDKETIAREVEFMRRSRLTSLGESLSAE